MSKTHLFSPLLFSINLAELTQVFELSLPDDDDDDDDEDAEDTDGLKRFAFVIEVILAV